MTRTRGHKAYASVAVDEATRWVWIKLLKRIKHTAKLATIPLLKRLHPHVKVFGSDKRGEFLNSETDKVLSELGIKREEACSDNQQQNGLAERTIGLLFETVRHLRGFQVTHFSI